MPPIKATQSWPTVLLVARVLYVLVTQQGRA
jgi:hypothetical protein